MSDTTHHRALLLALTRNPGSAKRWQERRERGLTDSQLVAVIYEEMGSLQRINGELDGMRWQLSTTHCGPWFRCGDVEYDTSTVVTIARQVLGIGQPVAGQGELF